MKKWFALALAVGILFGVGALLLSTRQAPLVAESDAPSSPTDGPASGAVTGAQSGAGAAGADSSAVSIPPSPGQEDHTHSAPMPQGRDPLEGKRLSTEEFRTMAAKVAKELPTKQSVQGLTDKDAHTMPKPMLEAGQQLGLIAQAVANEPSLAQDAYLFYEKCAGSSQYLDAVRALCFSNYKDLGSKLGLAVKEEVAPRKIRELAEKIQGL